MLGHQPDVLGTGDSAQDGGLLVGVGDALAGQEGRAAVTELDNDGRVDVTGSLEDILLICLMFSFHLVLITCSTALMVEVEVQLNAGSATEFFLQYSISFRRLSPVTTPEGTIPFRPMVMLKMCL